MNVNCLYHVVHHVQYSNDCFHESVQAMYGMFAFTLDKDVWKKSVIHTR